MINYTVIIPHKNRPLLLQRSLNAIPRREDVQIIIVDDNSTPGIVDFNSFPGLGDKNVEVVFDKKGKGAGYARNIGLNKAKGKWILFADSDDYYLDNLSEMMDRYADSDVDMIIFRQLRVDEKGQRLECKYDELFNKAIRKKDSDELAGYSCPIGRFIRRNLIEINHIRFQEVRYSNDVMFSLKLYMISEKTLVIDTPIYCVCESSNSLMRNSNWRNPYTRTKVALKSYSYIKSQRKNNFKALKCSSPWFFWWKKTIETNMFAGLMLIPEVVLIVGKKSKIVFAELVNIVKNPR